MSDIHLPLRSLESLYHEADQRADELQAEIYDVHASRLHEPHEFFHPGMTERRRAHERHGGQEDTQAECY